MVPLLGKYKNGNYEVRIYEDGTKVREGEDFKPEFPETIDLNISYKCERMCPFCYLGCTDWGASTEINNPATIKILKQINPYTEVAINLNSYDQNLIDTVVVPLLEILKKQQAITNVTLHHEDIPKYADFIHENQKKGFIYGVGVSISKSEDLLRNLIQAKVMFKNMVIHLVEGLVDGDVLIGLEDLARIYRNDKPKLLVLGYKQLAHNPMTIAYKSMSKNTMGFNKAILCSCLEHKDWVDMFSSVSYDNLAIDHLGIKDQIPKEVWDKRYMGDEGQFSMYIDLVEYEYAKSSCERTKPLGDKSIKEAFSEFH